MKNKISGFCSALEVRAKHFVILFFLAYFFLGLFIFKDYGVGWDEGTCRERGIITYDYIFHHDRSLLHYDKKNMGQLFDTFLVIIERNMMFSKDIRDIYFMRHFVVFAFFYAGVIFFYRLCFEKFRSWKIALLGCSFLIISPRIFANSFYNPKDIPFLSAVIISMYTMRHFLDKKTVPAALGHALSGAVAMGIRMVGFFMVVITCIFYITGMFIKNEEGQRARKSFLVYITGTVFFVFLFWPALWSDPIHQFKETMHQAENFVSLEFQVSEFGGSLEKIKPLLAKLGQPADRFTDIRDAVDWLNNSIKPFQDYVNYVKTNPINKHIRKMLPPGFAVFSADDFKKLAHTVSGHQLKRAILIRLYPQETPTYHHFFKMQNWFLRDYILYAGRHFDTLEQLPWHYIPVWIMISTPYAYSVCFFLGCFALIGAFLARPAQFLISRRDDVIYILLFFLPLLAILISRVAWRASSFNEWRHLFFIYPAFLLIAMNGLMAGMNFLKLRFHGPVRNFLYILFICFFAWSMLDTVSFMVRNHPFEGIYVNKLAGKDMQEVKDRFDLDDWGVSFRKALEYILRTDQSLQIPVYVTNFPGSGWLSQFILPAYESKRLEYVEQPSLAKYFLTDLPGVKPKKYAGEFYSINVDGAKIMVVYKINE